MLNSAQIIELIQQGEKSHERYIRDMDLLTMPFASNLETVEVFKKSINRACARRVVPSRYLRNLLHNDNPTLRKDGENIIQRIIRDVVKQCSEELLVELIRNGVISISIDPTFDDKGLQVDLKITALRPNPHYPLVEDTTGLLIPKD